MAEGWAECPALGPGWQRREAFRKSGATSGRSDTYYRSPTGQKFRSKIELRRFLGPGHDLSNFDFKSGLERPSPARTRKSPKWRLAPAPLPEPPKIIKTEEGVLVGVAETEKTPPLKQEATPIPIQAPPIPGQALAVQATPPSEPHPLRRTRKRPPLEPPQDGVVALCASCQSLFPGVSLPPQRRCRWLCPDCRAQRRDFNREQRYYKRVGCGSCQACLIPEDCGICSACARSPPGGPSSGPGRAPKCLLRRCLRIVKKGLGCGSCSGCLSTEDCGSCCICLRRLQPGLKRQWRCLRRRCLRPKKTRVAKKTPSPRLLTEKWKPPVEREPSDASSTRHRDPRLGLLIASAPRLKGAPPEPSVAPQRPPPGDLGVLIAATPRVKQEQPQPSASLVPVPPRPPPPQLVVLDESEEEEEEEEEQEGGSRVVTPFYGKKGVA
ncbi:hypothetical protein HGM15179_017667 [Zosterops borbonicus]|uniref:Methyl-CpG-binding domain protein 1 n=1 Tax=Zosterops borbonicus TaxID=364589 RepID=A0A8K1G0F3_9PASS|nr:hypothetical protein HGM15179_017667 [Zosterops borbonicus]